MKKIVIFIAFVIVSQSYIFGQQSDTLNRTDKFGKKYGYWKQYDNGHLLWEGQFYNGSPIGVMYHYYDNGQIETYSKYYINSPKVDAIIYHRNGQKAAEGEYIDKQKNGKWLYYSAKGVLISEENWDKGLKEGSCKNYSPRDGILVEDISWHKGKLHGPYKTYYASGQPRISMNYENGKMHGDFQCCYESGKIWVKGQYVNDLRNGTWTRYNENGNELKIEEIVNGLATSTILGFQIQGQWLKINATQIAYFYNQGDNIIMQLFNKKKFTIINTTLEEIESLAGVSLFIFLNPNFLSSYRSVKKVTYSTDEDGVEEAEILIYPNPNFPVIATGEECRSLKSLLNENEPSDKDE